MLKYMLDTNIAIYVIKRRPIEVLVTFNRYADMMCVSAVTEAELLHGAEKAGSVSTICDRWLIFISSGSAVVYQ